MTDILAQVGTKVGSEIKNLGIRLSSAENAIVNLGGQTPPPTGNFTIEPVTWTNLTEINLSGEKLLNTNFDPPPIGLGVSVEVLISWTNGGKTASVGEIYEIDLVQDNGGMRLKNSSQSLFASASQLESNIKALHPVEYVADSSLTSGGSGSSPVKIIVLTEVNLGGVTFSQGSILHGVGLGGTNNSLQRMEDPNDPRDYPYTTSNQSTGTWDWVDMSDRGVTWEYAKGQYIPKNWSVNSPINLDQGKLAQGIIKGDGGSVSVQQMFSTPISTGTKLVTRVSRSDSNSGMVLVEYLRANKTRFGAENVPTADGFVEFETTETTYGLRLSTAHGTREISSISLFQGEVSGGSVQAFTGGSLEKISGVDGYNAGASSVQKIDGQSNGYVQFQIGHANKSVKVGLVELDSDFEVDLPFKMIFGGGYIGLYSPWLSNYETYESGDWFRIRHYSANNEIHFQKREDVYQANPTGNYEVGTKVLILRDFSSAVKDEIVTIYFVNNSGVPSFEQENGTQFGSQAGITGFGRADWWEVAETIGQDYKTFYTHPTFSNGNDLYLDTTFHTIGSRINDVQIAKQNN